MSEPNTDQDFGLRGVEKSQDFEPMPVINPVKPPLDSPQAEAEREEYWSHTSDVLRTDDLPADDELRKAANEIAERRRQSGRDGIVLERQYTQQSGPDAGETMAENQTVSAEQAAHDLTNIRDLEANADKVSLEQEIAAAIDRIRAGDTAEQTPVTEPVIEQRQPVQQPEPNAQDAAIAKALQDNPALLNAVQQEIAQRQQLVDHAANEYVQAIVANSHAATAALLSNYPELAGLHPYQVPTAIQLVARQNPQRGQQMVNHIEQVRAMVAEGQQAQQQQAAQQQAQLQQQWNHYAAQHDAAYENFVKDVPAAERRAVEDEVRNSLRESGWSDETIANAWATDPALRSFAGQRQMWEAAKFRLSQKGAKSKVNRAVPTVQRPGSPMTRAPDSDIHLTALSRRLDQTMSVKDGAALVAARRQARRR